MLDRKGGIGTVGVIEVHVVDPQPRQGLVQCLMDVLWVGIYHPIGISMSRAKLCCKEDLVALPGPLEPILPKYGVGKGEGLTRRA